MSWPWNSAAMRRACAVHWPSWRSTRGKSLEGMATSATMPITISLPASKSNMVPSGSGCGARGSPLDLFGVAGLVERKLLLGQVVKRLCGLFRRVRLVQALLERLDSLGHVAHHIGDLELAAEEDENHRADDDPVPDRHATHLATSKIAALASAPRRTRLKLGCGARKNKNVREKAAWLADLKIGEAGADEPRPLEKNTLDASPIGAA